MSCRKLFLYSKKDSINNVTNSFLWKKLSDNIPLSQKYLRPSLQNKWYAYKWYCQALSELIPFVFANNNTNHARWLPIHLRDMLTLESTHPQLAQEFKAGNFVVHKTNRHFSALALDQAHEQANATIKADGGAIGLTEDPSALRRWMVAGPEVSRLVSLYEIEAQTNETSEHKVHHEQTPQAQRTFIESVNRLSQSIQDLGNPFQEESQDLYSLDTKDIAHPNSAVLLQSHMDRGKIKFQEFLHSLENNSSFFLWADREEQCLLFQGRFYSCWTVKAGASEGGLPAILKVVHLLSEQRVWSEGVPPTREPGIPSCAKWGWKAVQLTKVTAHIYPWDSCCTNRPRTQGRCPHRGWFSIGVCLTTEERKDIWELCNSGLPASDTDIQQQVWHGTHSLWCVQPVQS